MSFREHIRHVIRLAVGVLNLTLVSVSAVAADVEALSVFVNDDGVECVIVVNVKPVLVEVEGETAKPAAMARLRRHLAGALMAGPIDCEAESARVVQAVSIGALDQYGQPDWSTVELIELFGLQAAALANLDVAAATAAELAQALPSRP